MTERVNKLRAETFAIPAGGGSSLKWRSFFVMACVATIGLWVASSEYLSVLGGWIRRDNTDDTFLWPFALGWWERIGKALQFLAGMTIVLDLIDPAKLRNAALGALDHLRSLRAARGENQFMAHIDEVRRLTFYRFVSRYNGTPDGYLSYMGYHVPSPTWEAGVPEAPFTHDDYLLAHERFAEERRAHCGHRRKHRQACRKQKNFLSTLVNELIDQALSPEQRSQLEKTERINPHQRVRAGFSLLATVAFLAAFVWFSSQVRASSGIWSVGYLAGLLAMFALWLNVTLNDVIASRLMRGARILAKYGVIAASAPLLADLLDASRPGHRLRWIGFVLFVTGFHFDLLAT
ncbi:hypothetical protein [Micromonospora saelicesensis]|uniref:Uncharacterized protein n=1 Tax=Micromonospora saelicesensis TaxID=285676 RepID=A0A1C4VUJ0_9ACTN|nr:hypothetical protein [Micromonospora saelicesensis]SCE87637.1 hypothetical protein GA0070561_2087 [Micromonospora saelicesensis]